MSLCVPQSLGQVGRVMNLSWSECVIVCPPVSGAGGEGDELIME